MCSSSDKPWAKEWEHPDKWDLKLQVSLNKMEPGLGNSFYLLSATGCWKALLWPDPLRGQQLVAPGLDPGYPAWAGNIPVSLWQDVLYRSRGQSWACPWALGLRGENSQHP